MAALVEQVRTLHDEVLAGGGPQYVERHRSRGKMMVRERLEALVDPGTPVLELCARWPAWRRATRWVAVWWWRWPRSPTPSAW
jgi:acetyl-CoA carboxylase carboxyltransferase component